MEIFSLFIDDFTHLDGAVYDVQRGMIGISYKLGIRFNGSTNKEGVVFDFSKAKKLAKKIVDQTADHALIVSKDDVVYVGDERLKLKDGEFEYIAPVDAFFLLDGNYSISTLWSTLENLILIACKKETDCAELKSVELIVTREEISKDFFNFYHYTHGLKDSCSKCERPGHGHRSTIQIFLNESRMVNIEQSICRLYDDKHFIWSKNIKHENKTTLTIEYNTQKGTYTLTMPKNRVIIYPVETTVENISKVTAHIVKSMEGVKDTDRVQVYAFEGIGKGCCYILNTKYDPSLAVIEPDNHQLEFLKG